MKNPDFLSNRVIRVFISSTFQDMQDERNELMKKTFPILQRKAAERDVTLTELDLRWGITPQESKSGKVVDICLREIENSYPFFIGIIGNRYGWIPAPKDLERSTCERFSQVSRYLERRLSVTEMEMQFGVLERAEDMHAYFFIKEPIIPDEEEPEKLVALRTAVRANGRYPVSAYHSRGDLAQQVEAAFTKLLDKLFPEGALSELEKERLGQRAYLNSLCQNYIRTKANFDTINAWMSDWEAHQLVITGASGLGKSALVANWIKDHLSAEDSLPYRIIYHFVGNGGSLGSHGHVIKALCDEIRDRYGFDYQEKDVKTDEKALEALINRVAAEGDKPLLIVLDAINQIIDTDNAKQLNWLPIPPKNVKILFTTLTNDRTMEVFKNRRYPVFTLRPLTKRQRNKMVRGYLGIYSKKLQPYQIDRIVSDGQCRNTLALKTLLDELINFGIFEKLDKKIDSYLGTTSIEEFYGILLNGYEKDFGKQFVKHILGLLAVSRSGLSEEEILAITKGLPLYWSQFYCAFHQHLITKNGLISFAHTFIRNAVETRYLQGHPRLERTYRKEIVAQLQKDKYSTRAMPEIPHQYNILRSLPSLHNYLMNLDVFAFLYKVDEVSLGKYWYNLKRKGYSLEGYILLINSYPEEKRALILSNLSNFTRLSVVDPALSLRFIEQGLLYINDKDGLAGAYNMIGLSYESLGEYKKALEYKKKGLTLYRDIYGENGPYVARSYNNVGHVFGELGDYKKELFYYKKALKINQRNPRELFRIATSLDNIGCAYAQLGDFQKALTHQKKALDLFLRIYGIMHRDVATAYNNTGYTYGELGDLQNQIKFYEKAIEIRQFIYGEGHPDLAVSFNNIGVIYRDLGDNSKALYYQFKALDALKRVFGEYNSRVATVYDNIGVTYGKTGDVQKELKYEKKALTIRRRVLGDKHPDVALSDNNIGYSFGVMGNYEDALIYQTKALGILQGTLINNHPDYVFIYNNIAKTYHKLGDINLEIEYIRKALDVSHQCCKLKEEATYLNKLGIAYKTLGKETIANDYFRQAAEKYRELGDEELAQASLKEII